MARMGLLNDYLAYLLTVKDSRKAVKDTKNGNKPFNEADLASIILKSLPPTWHNQYNLNHTTLSKSPRQLLPDLEAIERIMNEKHNKKMKAKATAASANAKKDPKKRVSMGSNEPRVPKKSCTAKFCQHYKTNGGPYMTHNTKECRKYDKNGKAVAATAGKPYEKKPYKKNGGRSDKQMAYVTATIESLVKKGIKKAGKKKRKKRSYESFSSDSNSE